ncbi:MAG TPA: hypothetical protein VFE62_27250 [Gemmataceae bacterium]|nr:hypothetical protein [Gemmataceae bacterium]
MKRLPILGILLLIPAVILLFGTAGCTNKTDKGKTTVAATDGGKTSPTKTEDGKGGSSEITTAPEATIKGTIKYHGTPPEPKVDPRIAMHKDAKEGLCGTEKNQHEQVWIIGKDNGVANIIVSLSPPSGKKFKKLDEKHLEHFKEPVVIDQPFCEYVPHVVALYAPMQPLLVKTSAKMDHNVKVEAGSALGGTKDYLLKPNSDTGKISLKGGPEAVINASCSIHTWMNAKIGLFNQPYFAVTDKDGHFEIKNVPIDEEITVYLWHESNPNKVKAATHKTTKGANELKLEYPK